MVQKIYVGNLPMNIGNETLAEKFSHYGRVCSAKVIKNLETKSSMGFAFVEMATPEEAQQAIVHLNGSLIGDRPINVVEAMTPSQP